MNVLEIMGFILLLTTISLVIMGVERAQSGKGSVIVAILTIASFVGSVACAYIGARQEEKIPTIIEYDMSKCDVSYKFVTENGKTDTILIIKQM